MKCTYKYYLYWIIRTEIVGKRFLPDTVKTAKQDVIKPTHQNCSIAIKNEIYSSSLFMIMTIFYVFSLTFKRNNGVNPLTVGSAISHRTFMENK